MSRILRCGALAPLTCALLVNLCFGNDFRVEYSFSGGANEPGTGARGDLAFDGSLLFGMTPYGGVENDGVLFSFDPVTQQLVVLHHFRTTDSRGYHPVATPTIVGNKIYSMTNAGGMPMQGLIAGGTVFTIDKTGANHLPLFSFNSIPDTGRGPIGTVIHQSGKLWGMSQVSGAFGGGALFSMNDNGTGFQIHHQFGDGNNDALQPFGHLTPYNGRFYGVTNLGGTFNDGVIFSVRDDGADYTIHHHFGAEGNDGNPRGSLISDGSGNFFGMTAYGAFTVHGTIFKFDSVSNQVSVLHQFSGSDGQHPQNNNLLMLDGKLYGMTTNGGQNGKGTIFKINTDGSEFTILHEFTNGVDDGGKPHGGLTLANGRLYGMCWKGGAFNQGVIFSISPNPTETAVPDLVNAVIGSHESGQLSDVDQSDDQYLKYNSGFPFSPSSPAIWLEFEGTLSSDSPSAIQIVLESQVNDIQITQKIEAFNYNTGQFEQVDTRPATRNADSIAAIDLPGDVTRFVEPGTGHVKTKVTFTQGLGGFFLNWRACIDQMVWVAQ